jgi:hypothetical protein
MRKYVATGSAVLIALAVLAGCGGSSSKSSPLTPGTTKSGGSSKGGGSSSDFSALVANASKQKFKITYATSGGDTQTYAQDGNGNSVYGSGDSQFFTNSKGSTSCHTTDGKATCTSLQGAGAGVSPFLGLFQTGKAYIDALGTYGHKSDTTIAGRSASCVSFSAKDLPGAAGAALGGTLKGSAEYCVDKDTGVLLKVSTTDGSGKDSTQFEVTKFESPSDSEFTPPAKPTTVSLPPGITIPGGG